MCSDIMYSSHPLCDCFLLCAGRVAQLKLFNGQFIGSVTSAHWHTHTSVSYTCQLETTKCVGSKLKLQSEKRPSTVPTAVLIGEFQHPRLSDPTVSTPINGPENNVNEDS